jgi:radical SAM superfamily enzyme YgiQ (UPF0313 family)
MGGVHASYCYDSILLNHSEVDCVVRAEGERVFSDLVSVLSDHKDLAAVPGISYQSPHGPKHTPDAPLIHDLDSLPFDVGRVLDRIEYRAELFDIGGRTTSTIVGRGCSFRCVFCSESRRFGSNVRMRSVEHVLMELGQLAADRFASVYFEDDVFTINRRWIEHFCDEMLRRQIDIGWHCETRADLVDLEMLRRMRDAGCRHIFFGAESLNQEVLNISRRGLTVKEIADALGLCADLGIETFVSIQLGLPGDTLDGMRETITRLAELPATQTGVAFTSAYPGTKLFDDAHFPLDIYERYREPADVTDWLARRVGHGVNSIHPFFLDWDRWRSRGEICHDIQAMLEVFSWCEDGLSNLWHPTQELRPQARNLQPGNGSEGDSFVRAHLAASFVKDSTGTLQ